MLITRGQLLFLTHKKRESCFLNCLPANFPPTLPRKAPFLLTLPSSPLTPLHLIHVHPLISPLSSLAALYTLFTPVTSSRSSPTTLSTCILS